MHARSTVIKDAPANYTIKFQGRLDASWADWFDGMSVQAIYDQDTSVTSLYGTLKDQAALHGILARIRDLSLVLLSVERAST